MPKDAAYFNSFTQQIIGCAYRVGNVLGSGFLEKVYERALAHELQKEGLDVACQYPIKIFYDGIDIGDYFADLVIGNEIIVELKTVKNI